MRRVSAVGGLVAATHPGPALAVTVLSGLLAVAAGLDAGATALLVVTVLCGPLTVGWSNDLLDPGRDRSVGRTDKPLATGRVSEGTVRTALAAAIVATLVLSPLNGLAAGAVHLLIVASAWSYNLGLKATAFSWVPYAVSFGGLPVFVAATADPPG